MMQYVGSLSVCVGDEGGGEGSIIHPPLPESTPQRQMYPYLPSSYPYPTLYKINTVKFPATFENCWLYKQMYFL